MIYAILLLQFYRINPGGKCFLRKMNNSSNSIQYFHTQKSPEGYLRTFDETMSDTSRIRLVLNSGIFWKPWLTTSAIQFCEMDLDLHFNTLFSVVGKHLMCCSANICNKLSRYNFSSTR